MDCLCCAAVGIGLAIFEPTNAEIEGAELDNAAHAPVLPDAENNR